MARRSEAGPATCLFRLTTNSPNATLAPEWEERPAFVLAAEQAADSPQFIPVLKKMAFGRCQSP
ncbi:hypothetical protein [Streptomyces olivochromogenes]|uniref:hypothetical protein n=1 Tax=Streptomyces olivochromogenes TaxID=1963 RepID=UPI0036C04FF1